jgi:hypothetical protein
MTALIFHDEVFIKRNPNEQSASCEFQFKGHQFSLSHKHEFSLHHNKHHFSCQIDGEHYSFGVVRSRLGKGSYGNKPILKIDGQQYSFVVEWPNQEGRLGVKFAQVTY